MIPPSASSGTAPPRSLPALFFLLLLVHPSFAQPATLLFDDCYTGDASRKMSVDTVYSQIIDDQTLNFTVLGDTAADIINSNTSLGTFTRRLLRATHSSTPPLAATLFIDTTTLTITTYSNGFFLCNSIRPPSPLPTLTPPNTTYCPIPVGPYAFTVSTPFNSKNFLTTMNTQLRALDTNEQEILCLTVATTPLQPGPYGSPYGRAHTIFWATVGLAIAYWLIVGTARIIAAWGRGLSRPGPGVWHRVQSAGFILASAISGERLATSPALMRFCMSLVSISVYALIFARLSIITRYHDAHAMVCRAGHGRRSMATIHLWVTFLGGVFGSLISVSLDPLLSQTAWATLAYSECCSKDTRSRHRNVLIP